MRLDWTRGTPLFCRQCQQAVPHFEAGNTLVDGAGHRQHPLNPMLSLSVEEEVDPAVMLLPMRSWSSAYVTKRYVLLTQWKDLNHGN